VAAVAAGDAMQTTTPSLLFVYGTLRPQLIGSATTSPPRSLVSGLVSAGAATVNGLLLDLGAYPGFVPESPGDPGNHSNSGPIPMVIGDLLEVNEMQLAVLDDYEECGGHDPLYVREVTTATRHADGQPVACWIYRYCRDTAGARLIASGDYARHLGEEGTAILSH
jgi:gamma-glutamylcyclotransferase (GGCT)/AIG2-like uncharacterized protein YtfP